MSIDFSTINVETLVALAVVGLLAGIFVSMIAIMFNKWLDWLHSG